MANLKGRRPRRLTAEERKSVTHGDFWIPDEEREIYKRALEALNAANIPYVVAGAYAIYEHTGIYRKTKDLDLFFEPAVGGAGGARAPRRRLRHAARGSPLARQGDDRRLTSSTSSTAWATASLASTRSGSAHSRPGILAATPVRIAPRRRADLAPPLHRRAASPRHVGRRPPDPVPGRHARLGAPGPPRGPALAAAAGAAADVQLRLPRVPVERARNGSSTRLLEQARSGRAPRTPDELDLHAGSAHLAFQLHDRRSRVGLLGSALPSWCARRATNPEIRAIVEADVWDERGEDRPEPREDALSVRAIDAIYI